MRIKDWSAGSWHAGAVWRAHMTGKSGWTLEGSCIPCTKMGEGLLLPPVAVCLTWEGGWQKVAGRASV